MVGAAPLLTLNTMSMAGASDALTATTLLDTIQPRKKQT